MIEQIANISQLQDDIILLHSFVHGAEGDSVMLGSVNTPSLRNLVATIKRNVDILASAVTEYENRLEAVETAIASMSYDEAEVTETISSGETEVYSIQTLSGLVPQDKTL